METSEFAAPSTSATPAGHPETPSEQPAHSPGAVINGVLVTGMHRSGTSAVAHVLASAGLYPGPADDQMAPTIENPRGYAELLPVMLFNDALLAAKGWLWDAPPAAAEPVAADATTTVDDGRIAIRSIVTRSPWVLKDPRISLLMPEWRKVLLDRFVVVFTVRSPAEVAWSLAVRNDVSISVGLSLWAAYYRHLCAGLNGLSAVAVDYAALTTDARGTTAALLDALRGLGVHTDADAAAVSDAVSPSLRRTTVPETVEQAASAYTYEQVMPGYEPRPVVVWQKFDLAPGQPRGWEVDLLDERRARRHAEIAGRNAGADARAAREALDGLREELGARQAELDAARADAQAARAAGEREEAELAAECEKRGSQIAALVAERDGLTDQLAAARTERDQLAARERQARNLMERINNEVARAREDNARLMEAAERARGQATQLQALVDVYEGSTSWRLTAPLRRFGRALRETLRRR